MPLDRQHVTSGSRIMLPTYLATYLLLGLEFLFQEPSRTSGPVFDPARLLVPWLDNPMQGWGALFVAIATLEAIAMLRHERMWEIVALGAGLMLAVFWSTILLFAATQDKLVSYTSGTWLLIPVAAHFATMLTLARREGSAQ